MPSGSAALDIGNVVLLPIGFIVSVVGLSLLFYFCGLIDSCTRQTGFTCARFKGRMSLIFTPLGFVVFGGFVVGLVLLQWESIWGFLIGMLFVVALQVIWACAELGILHGLILRRSITRGLAGTYSRERKRMWVRLLQPGRWIVLRAMLPSIYASARSCRRASPCKPA